MLDAIDAQLAPGRVVIFGELHGTMEVPRFVALAAERAATRGPVTVALELPDDLQPGVDAFLAAADDASGRAARWPGPPGVTLFAERHAYGWDGAFQVGELTPSMPLVR